MRAKLDFGVARCVGRKDFDGAVRLLEDALAESSNADDMAMLATCHRWAGRPAVAIEVAEQVLVLDVSNFDAIQLLSELHAERKDYAAAASYARLGLENYPEPAPPAPKDFHWVLQVMVALVPRMRRIEESTRRTLEDPGAGNRKWHRWATGYLAWYDQNFGEHGAPTLN